MHKMKLLTSWDTEYSADSVEWCPDENFRNIFICGTYKLEQSSSTENDDNYKNKIQLRVGRLYLFKYQNFEPFLQVCQAIEMSAILDCKWCPVRINNKILLAVADAKGKICIFQLSTSIDDNDKSEPLLKLIIEKELPSSCEDNKLSLSIDWSLRLNSKSYDEVQLAVSDSKGCITILALNDTSLDVVRHWKAHDFEAWIVSFNQWNSSVIYSGGDDCRLCIYDIRCSTDYPVSVSKLHSAGVTSMNYSPFHEFKFVSGSYDENVFLWDTRQMKRNTGSVNVGGGVWRLKWEPIEGQYLLAACMYNGFRVLNCVEETNLEIISEFNEHKSIAYGTDWSHMSFTYLRENYNSIFSLFSRLEEDEDIKNIKLVSTCSFYDHKLCVSYLI